MADRLISAALVLFGTTVAWLLLASAVWSGGTHQPFSPLGWWDATQWWRTNWWVNLWLVLAAIFPSIILVMTLFAYWQWARTRGRGQRRLTAPRPRQPVLIPFVKPKPVAPLPIVRGVTDNHGHSEWRSIAGMMRRFRGPSPQWGGVAAGEAYRVDHDRSHDARDFDPEDKTTWGLGGKAPLLIDDCSRGGGHHAIFAGTGGFKSSNAVITALTWIGSSVIYDPTIELGPLLDGALRRQRKTVCHIGLPDPTKTIPMTGFNVLKWIDITHPEAEIHVHSVVSWIYDEEAAGGASHIPGRQEDPFFGKMGRGLITCLLAHLLWSDPAKIEISLATFAVGMATPEEDMISLLYSIESNSKSAMARRLAGALMQARAPETFSGIYLNAINGVKWLFSSAYADLVSVGNFDPRSLLLGNTTVFLNINLRTIDSTPAIPRVLIGALLNTLFMADGHVHGKVLFLIDEAKTLGKLRALETARDLGRHYGLVIEMLWQSIGQMRQIWGTDGTTAWIDAFSWVGYASIRAAGAGKDLSRELGGHGVLAYSEGDNQGQQRPLGLSFGTFSRGHNLNVHEIHRHLITAAEMQQSLRSDEIIIVPDTGMPIRCGRAIWWRRPEIVAQITNTAINAAAS